MNKKGSNIGHEILEKVWQIVSDSQYKAKWMKTWLQFSHSSGFLSKNSLF